MTDKTETSVILAPSLKRGAGIIAEVVKTLTGSPGVYRMLDEDGNPLYVGKAKNLKKRVVTYSRPDRLPVRLQRMIAATRSMEIVETHTEVEALLLESNLIKKLKPRYNVMLRDDKSFPYILLTSGTDWAQLIKHRGGRSRDGEYFGPFASAGAVNRTLAALQRAFPLRNCSDNIFAGRTRPCLQYQIKRCTAPCVDRISHEDYGTIVDEARDFLTGDSRNLQKALLERMETASDAMEYETAAIFRDRIKALTQIQAHQDINVQSVGDADIVAAHAGSGIVCIQVFFFRNGQNFGNRTYFPTRATGLPISEILASFLGQFYSDKTPPPTVLVSETPPDRTLIADALSVRAGRKVTLSKPARGSKRTLVDHALANAREALARRLAESSTQRRLLEGLADILKLDSPPQRIEVYDNSHISGSKPVGGMIVAGPDGLIKNAYRKFNIKDQSLEPGDDYGMMQEVLTRRFQRAQREDPDRQSGNWPDLVLIDGGQGHLSAVCDVMEELAVDDIPVVAIAKGPDRDAGRERFFMVDRPSFMLKPNDPVLYFLQRLRDEAHRFAIGSHRVRRKKAIGESPLDEIVGVGANRKRALLHHFGSARSVGDAGVADLEAVKGISGPLAKKIYDHFHSDG
ncbi:MAG: excinuclease ABC subunit C [Rhodospirillaceae bacterium]|nr:excinuclease ABC subunit C [Rhodospirillaceae bacterium]|tara:strand:- start:72698 stop:74584 length:1887 start_codon:yes stop_codon:yes gene_type:complete